MEKINSQKLADRFGFELDEIEMVIETFLETSKQNLEDIENSINNNDKETLSHAAHSLKGSSATLELNKISEIAKEIEISAKNNELIDYNQKYEELKNLLNNIL